MAETAKAQTVNRKWLLLSGVALGISAGLMLRGEWALLVFSGAVCLAFSAWAMQELSGVFDCRRVTIVGFWYITYLLMIFFPSFVIFSEHSGFARYRFIAAVFSALLTAPLGVYLANRLFNSSRAEIVAYYDKTAEADSGAPFAVSYAVAALAAIALTALYFSQMQTIPLIYLLNNPGKAAQALLLREESSASLGNIAAYMVFVLKSLLYPFLVSVALGAYMMSRKKSWLLMLLVIGCAGLFCALATTSKGQAASIVLVACVFFYVYKGGRLGGKFTLAAAASILLLPLALFYLLYPQGGLALALKNIVLRLCYSPADMVYYYFEVFPDYVNYLYGASIGKVAWLFGLDFFDAPVYVAAHLNNFAYQYGSANAAFIADANANFGMPGVLIMGVLAGFTMQCAQVYIMRLRKTVISMALYAYLLYAFWQLNSDSLQLTLMSGGVIFALLLFWGIIAGERLVKFAFSLGEPQ